MFYATKIKQVSGDKAIDERGRVLSFVGYLPVTAGDTVITDGTVIFGNVKVKGGYSIFDDTLSGIPVLGSRYLLSLYNSENLKGFFCTNGKYKKYEIAGENWFVNGRTKYFHDIGEKTILDAEISRHESGIENGLYILTKDSFQVQPNEYQYDYVFEQNEILTECELVTKKDSVEKKRVKFSTLLENAKALAMKYVQMVEVPEHEPEDFVSIYADLHNTKIMPDGSWEILIQCRIYVVRRFKRTNKILNFETTSTKSGSDGLFPSDFPWGGTREEIADAFRQIGCSEITTNQIIYNNNLAQAIYNVVYDDIRPWSWDELIITYGTSAEIGTKNEETDKYYNTTANCYFLLKISSQGDIEKCCEQSYCTPLDMPITDYTFHEEHETLQPTGDKDTYPYISSRSISQILTGGYTWQFNIYNFRGTVIRDQFYEQEQSYTKVAQITYVYDSSKLSGTPLYNKWFREINENFTFPIQDGYRAKILPYYRSSSGDFAFNFDGVYDSKGKIVISKGLTSTDANTWNMSIVLLKDNTFLFGIHDRDLYKLTTSGVATRISSDLKNFRLRELKDMRKAKT